MADDVPNAKVISTSVVGPEASPRLATAIPNGTRVFISYSHEDREIADNIAEALEDQNIDVLYGKDLSAGGRFTDQIKHFIAHAHVFLPVLTARSETSKWVQQEIGYAVALGVLVVPLAIRCDPGEFLHGIEAIRSEDETLGKFKLWLSEGGLEKCVAQARDVPALYECADTQEERAALIAKYANAVASMDRCGQVRQLGSLGSFHIPTEPIRDDVWLKRYGTKGSTEYHRDVLRQERLALTKHAEKAGCKIIIDVDFSFEAYGSEARVTRLKSMRNFLREMNDANCQVALTKDWGENLLIVGGWFARPIDLAQAWGRLQPDDLHPPRTDGKEDD